MDRRLAGSQSSHDFHHELVCGADYGQRSSPVDKLGIGGSVLLRLPSPNRPAGCSRCGKRDKDNRGKWGSAPGGADLAEVMILEPSPPLLKRIKWKRISNFRSARSGFVGGPGQLSRPSGQAQLAPK